MKKRGFIRRLLSKKTKTGASLLVVIIAVTMLIVMGSTFSVIAMGAYNNSHRRLCQQQAFYTAQSCLNVLSTQFANDPSGKYMTDIKEKITNEFDSGGYANVSDVRVVIARLKDIDGNDGVVHIPENGLEASLLGITGACVIEAQAAEGTKSTASISQIKLIATGTYKGYSQTVIARMSTTTKGGIELKKIFSNSQCWKTPVVTLIAGETTGDMYFLSPGNYYRYTEDGSGQIIQGGNGEIVTDQSTTFGQKNEALRTSVYGNVASGNSANLSTGIHTRPFDIYNKPQKVPETRCAGDVYGNIFASDTDLIQYECYHDWDKDATKKAAYDKQWDKYKAKLTPYYYVGVPKAGQKYLNFYIKDADRDHMTGPNGEKPQIRTQRWWWYQNNPKKYKKYEGIEGEASFVNMGKPQEFRNAYTEKKPEKWYNDWTEIYMFTGQKDNGKNIVNGDMYVNTKALIGLYDKYDYQLHYWPYIDGETDLNKVERKYASYNTKINGEGNKVDYFRDGDMIQYYDDLFNDAKDLGSNFEHGGAVNADLFFDYNHTAPPQYDQSVLGHNGNMYLFQDARIECYDSTKTPNAQNNTKNNIFAHQNLVIDGFAMKQGLNVVNTYANPGAVGPNDLNYWMNHIPYERNVNIYGDIMVEGNLTISSANIYGDIYVNGDELLIRDTDIYGNVYFNGSMVRMDNVNIRGDERTKYKGPKTNEKGEVVLDANGNMTMEDKVDNTGFSFLTPDFKPKKLNGGDLIIFGNGKLPYDKYLKLTDKEKEKHKIYYYNEIEATHKGTYEEERDRRAAAYNDMSMWGAILTNTCVSGTLYSGINTKINASFVNNNAEQYSNADGERRIVCDLYNDITVDGHLYMDLTEIYRHDMAFGDQNYLSALINNCIQVKGICLAQAMMIETTQSGDNDFFRHTFNRYEWPFIKKDGVSNGKIHSNNVELWFSKDSTGIDPYYDSTTGRYQYGDPMGKAVRDSNSPFYRCVSVNINALYVGDGGLFVDGTSFFFEEYDGSIYARGGGKTNHTAITINDIFTTCASVKNNDYNKVVLWNTAGKPGKETGYTRINLHTYKTAANPNPAIHGTNEYINSIKVLDTTNSIHTTIQDRVKKLIKDEIAARLYPGEDFIYSAASNSVSDTILELSDYYITNKAPHRVNGYYKYAQKASYLEIHDMSTWANNKKGEGPYPKYDPKARDGIWRQIKMLEWRAPEGVKKLQIVDAQPSKPEEGKTYLVSTHNSVTFDRQTWEHEAYDVSKMPSLEKYIDNTVPGQTVIMASIETDYPIYIPDNHKLIFDTSQRNLHCILNHGLLMGKHSQIVLRGGGMTFLYVENDPSAANKDKTPDNLTNLVIGMDEGAIMGVIDNSEDIPDAMDSIYVVSNDACLVQMKSMATIRGYIYTPHGYLKIDEYHYQDDGTKVYHNGTKNTVLHGSLVVRSFIVDMSISYNKIQGMYKNLKYEYVMAPLISDLNIEFGNNQTQIDHNKTPDWGFIGYD